MTDIESMTKEQMIEHIKQLQKNIYTFQKQDNRLRDGRPQSRDETINYSHGR